MASAGESAAPRLFEVDRFEHVGASSQRILLRVDGRYVERPGRRVLDATLYVDDGLAIRRHGALADPAAEDDSEPESWLWRAAFAVPAAYLTDARTSFALEAQPGVLLALPEPRGLALAARPLSQRAVRTARRYAAAIAVLVTVAVVPGVLPASARTEILRVRHPDGSVVYLTPGGHPIAQLPPNAYVVDQSTDTLSGAGGAKHGLAATGAPSGASVSRPQRAAPAERPATRAPSANAPSTPAAASALGSAPARRRHVHRAGRHPAPQAPPVTPSFRLTRAPGGPGLAPLAPIDEAPAGDTLKSLQALAPVSADASAPPLEPLGPPPKRADMPRLEPLAEAAAAPARPSLEPLGEAAAGPTRPPLEPLVAPAAEPARPPLEPLDEAAAGPTRPPLEPLVGVPAPTSASAPALEPLGQASDNGPRPATTGGAAQHRSGASARPTHPRPSAPSRSAPSRSTPPLIHIAPAPAPAPTSAPTSGAIPNASFFNALPGPGSTVPGFVIDNFQIPPFLLSIYQAAGTQYGIKWQVLAGINEIETNYGRDLSVSSAGALGWMQFMPDTWKTYGVDANRDGKEDPYNPVDAIFAAARYLKAAGGDKNIRQAVYAYNHAGWYVDSVMLRAQLIAAYPPQLVGALTGLTQGRFPVAAPARYAGEVTPGKPSPKNVPPSSPQGTDIYTRAGAPVVAVQDGVVKRLRRSRTKGLYVVLQDAYGNEYTYSGLGSIAKMYPVPKVDSTPALAQDSLTPTDPAPSAAASAGGQTNGGAGTGAAGVQAGAPATPAARPVVTKVRFFAHPERPNSQAAGGAEQVFEATQARSGFEVYDGYFADVLGLNSKNATLRPLVPGANVVASTVLGQVGGDSPGRPAHLHFEVRPAGKGAPTIDPRPILDGWRLSESTQVYGPSGRDALSKKAGPITVGETMLMPKPLLEQRVLSDKRVKVYAAGREDIATGQVDRRVLEVLEYLADAGLSPTVSGLKSGQGGGEPGHDTGSAVDISAINDVPIRGHQDKGGVTEQAVRSLMQLDGTLRPDQIVSLLALGQNSVGRPDHGDHIHVSFKPLFGDNASLGKTALSVLGPQQWNQLAQRLGQLDNPSVPTVPSRYALPDS